MENETRFDLNAALENWRTELAAQLNFSVDDRRELETHLRDTFAELKSRGLSEEESFWLAQRRVGQPQKLAEEFVKADPAQAWRKPMFWLVLTLLTIRLWNVMADSLTTPFFVLSTLHAATSTLGDCLPKWASFYLPASVDDMSSSSIFIFPSEAIIFLLPLTIVFLLVRGESQKLKALMDFIFKSRARFSVCLLALVILDYVASSSILNALTAKPPFHHTNSNFFFVFLNQGLGLFCLTALAILANASAKSSDSKTDLSL
jgi:hypothetical protein